MEMTGTEYSRLMEQVDRVQEQLKLPEFLPPSINM